MSARYPIRAVAKLTGLSPDILRAWERRYGAVRPSRGGRGRVYGDAEIQRLILLRRAVESGHAIGQVAALSDPELEELQRASQASAGAPQPAGAAQSQVLQPLLRALAAYDHAAVNEELGRMALLLDARDLVHKVVLPLMQAAGRAWEEGLLQVAHEHLLSACVRNLLGGLLRRESAADPVGTILLTTPAGELHEFGVLAAALLAASLRLRPVYLGPNLPAGEILFAAGQVQARAVVLGVMQVNATPAVRAEVERLARDLHGATEFWLGGSGRREASAGAARRNLVLLEDLAEYERHLLRLGAIRREEAPL
jgi:DNA-binding transcriptional MerR regulator